LAAERLTRCREKASKDRDGPQPDGQESCGTVYRPLALFKMEDWRGDSDNDTNNDNKASVDNTDLSQGTVLLDSTCDTKRTWTKSNAIQPTNTMPCRWINHGRDAAPRSKGPK
jgi:hypothetical protein